MSRALATLMKRAGVKFAILGNEETCTGDPARRLGNEYLYATVARHNIETLGRYEPRRIVTQCPHCYHNLKKEYPDFDAMGYAVLHEAEFLDELRRAGRLRFERPLAARITLHDPCFMALHDGKWESARTLLNAILETEVQDAAESKTRTYCCGAGGGCFWKEEVGGTRINEHSLSQLTRTNSETVAVGWPFCMTMLEDPVKACSLEETIRVRDLSELVAAAIDPEPITNEAKTPMSGKKMI